MQGLKNFETRIKVKEKKMYKIRIFSLPIYSSTPLEIEREGRRNQKRRKILNGEEGERGSGSGLEIWTEKEKNG